MKRADTNHIEQSRVLITAGPTQEAIDSVRFIGNRSSGRLGVELADAAAARGNRVKLLLGPTGLRPGDSRVDVERFRSTEDLRVLMEGEVARCDVLVMAAAVADFRPRMREGEQAEHRKLRRSDGPITLELEPTPDLLAVAAEGKRGDQVFVGFALEPRERLMESAREKLARKKIDMVVANPLETMDSEEIEARVIRVDGAEHETNGKMEKRAFAGWLLDVVDTYVRTRATTAPGRGS